MMRGLAYDDNYIARKMNALDAAPSYNPLPSYGFSQDSGFLNGSAENGISSDGAFDLTSDGVSEPISRSYVPSARTKLILNRVAMSQPRGYTPAPRCHPMPPRMGPPPPTYYDYDYGYGSGGYGGHGGYGAYRPSYGSGYGYGYPPPPQLPRYRNYDPYGDEEYDMNYVPRYRPARLSDALVELEKEKLRSSISPVRTPIATTKMTSTGTLLPQSDYMAKHFSPGMLQDQVDKMRTRLQAMSYSLEPTGPVPDLGSRLDHGKKYSSALDMAELPHLSARKTTHLYPEDHYMKDNFRIKCLSHYKTTRSAAEYWKPKLKYGDNGTPSLPLPTYTSKLSSSRGGDQCSKWEEPGTVYTKSSEIRPFSKTNETEEDDQKKERRRKKKSKERDDPLAIESSASAEASHVEASISVENGESVDAADLDEKEKKKLEKKKRKAEREAAAKAAMEAELAALAEAEAELARLEAESAGVKAPAELKTESSVLSPAAVPQPKEPEPEPEVKLSEETTEKCESPTDTSHDLKPDCPPTQSECEPSILPSSDNYVAEESLQDPVGMHVEEPVDTSEYVQDQSAKDILEDELVEQVTEAHYEPEVTENDVCEPDLNTSSNDAQFKSQEATDDEQGTVFQTEAIWDEPVEGEADAKDEASASIGDGGCQEIGESEVSEVYPEEPESSVVPGKMEEEVGQSVEQAEETKQNLEKQTEVEEQPIEVEEIEVGEEGNLTEAEQQEPSQSEVIVDDSEKQPSHPVETTDGVEEEQIAQQEPEVDQTTQFTDFDGGEDIFAGRGD